jgi:hypothetical protein
MNLAGAFIALWMAASNTLTEAAQISGPVPSPSINGMIGSKGTLIPSFVIVIFEPSMLRFALK